jgi:Xaa-Pro aminopeptidase
MLTAEGCAKRRGRLWKALPSDCDALILADPAHLTYFAAYDPSPFVFRTVESSAVLLLEPDRATLIGDDMLGPFLEKAHVDEVVAPVWYDGRHSAPHRRSHLAKSALDRLTKTPGHRIGAELASVPAGIVDGLRSGRPNLELLDLDPLIRPLRRAKDPDEIATLKRSMMAGEAAHAEAMASVKPGMTETEVYELLHAASVKVLGEPAILYGDVASGIRCERDRGGPPTSRKIEPGDLLLLDFSVVVSGYRGDFTNTFSVGGKATDAQKKLFDACLGAMKAGEDTLKPGAPAKDVDAAVRGHFARLGYEKEFPHHSGHGLGLGHPEPPYFVPESADVVQLGDVVTLEPGLYVPGTGGMRIERNYLITDRGFETLSNHQIRIDP